MFLMAWRNLWRNRRRTLITLASIAFGVLLAGTQGGVANYKYVEMIDQSTRMGLGHVTVEPAGYLANPSLKLRLDGVSDLRQAVLASPGVLAAYPRIQGPALFSTAARDVGGLFIAVDPGLENAADNIFLQSISSGSLPQGRHEDGTLCGDGLARKLKLKLGQKMVITVNDVHGQMSSTLLHLKGTFHTGVDEVDNASLLLPLGTASTLLGYAPDQASLLAVMLKDHRQSIPIASALQARWGGRHVEVKAWNETLPQMDGLIKVDKVTKGLMMLLLGLMISMGVLNTSLMSVIERQREFGVMLALGLSPWNLVRLVLTEALFTGLMGLAAGVLVSAPWILYLQIHGLDLTGMLPGGKAGLEVNGAMFKPMLHAVFYSETVVRIVGVAMALVLVAGLYPAWKAASVPPIEAIRND
jgi:ABC-type lipoprotein release transport system permease subunit